MPEGIADARDALQEGGLIVYPTDTLYGLGCDATNQDAIERLRTVKRFERDRGVSVLFATVDEAKAWTRWTPTAQALARSFLPGPLTIILDARARVPQALLPPQGTLAVRHVRSDPARALARVRPLVATSANKHKKPSCETIDDAREAFGREVDAYVDGGQLTGPASTVVDARGKQPMVIREGPLTEDEILEAVNRGG